MGGRYSLISMRPDQQLAQALSLIHGGQLAEANGLCTRVLVQEPRNFNAQQLLGHIALQSRDYAEAVRWLSSARSLNPSSAMVHSNLAVALLGLRRPGEAIACCDRALGLKADFPEAHCNRGNALRGLDRPEEALVSYQKALSLAPGFYDAIVGSVNALLSVGRCDEALAGSAVVLRMAPHSAEALCLRGTILLKCRRPDEALAAFDQALCVSTELPEAHNNRGTALRDLGRPEEALAAFDIALRLRPEFAEVYCNIANIGLDMGRMEEALAYGERALRIRPGMLDALNIRGTALRVLGRYAEAASSYEKILAAAPLYGQARSYLLFSRANLADWSERTELAARIIERVESGSSASAPHPFLWICDSAATQFQCASLYAREQFPPAAPLWRGEVYGHRRLRIAYLSADFSDHPVAHLIAGVLERHDRSRFEVIGVSLHKDTEGSAMQLRMQNAFEHFYDASHASDLDVALQLRRREIDMVVDLTGYTRNGRLGILAHRPAPLQINYLGYAGTSGASYVDYLVGDSIVVPTYHERFYSEKLIRMPHCFLPNDDRQPVATDVPRRCDLGLPDTGFVFCAFNNIYKINPMMFDIWMDLLRKTSGSVLWLRGGEEAVQANLGREARARGVDAGRLVFAGRVQRMDAHLARYAQADLFLDTLPYGAHATARDALWAGLPVLTCVGNSFAGRVAASLLTALEFPELVALSREEYTAKALALAHSPLVLAELRARLAHQRAAGRTFDTDLYRRHLESAYLTLAERQRQGETPRRFDVIPAT
jgi:protein O-GlcNAc transferase